MTRLAIAGLALALVLPGAATAAPGYELRAVAVEGDPAVGVGGATWTPTAVAIGPSGDVAFLADLSTALPDSGVWVDSDGVVTLRSAVPDAAPSGGTYSFIAGFPKLDGSGALAFPSLTSAGASGLFLDTAGVDTTLVVSGESAPAGVGGTLDASIADLQLFGRNDAGDLVFRSGVTGGAAPGGLFLEPGAGGATQSVVLEGDAAPGAGGTFSAFGWPSLNAGGTVVFDAAITGGSADHGIFVDPGGGVASLALAGDAAPGTGGAVYDDMALPRIADSGVVAFVANTIGGAASGGVFSIHGAGTQLAVLVEGGAAPGGGSYVGINGGAVVASDGSVAVSASLAGGTISGGVFVRRGLAGPVVPVATLGETLPGLPGVTLAATTFVEMNDLGEIAFLGELSDGRAVAVLATPSGLPIPAVPAAGLALLAVGLALLARRATATTASPE